MKRRINPIRLRLIVAIILAFSALAFGGLIFQVMALRKNSEDSHRARTTSLVQLVKLFLELERPGDWEIAGAELRKGGAALPAAKALRESLSEYLSPDTAVFYEIGEPPAEPTAREGKPPNEPGPPPPGDPFPAMSHPDFPFATENGAGIVVRGSARDVVGWIRLENGPSPKDLREDRFLLSFVSSAAGLNLLLLAALGVLVLRLSKPIDAIAEAHERAAARNVELAGLSRTDPLTGLLNRRGLEEVYEEFASRGSRPSYVALLDIDHFKAINDERGHDEGDGVLRSLADLILASVRQGDRCCRWGGEEFLLLLYDLPEASVGGSAERLRAAVECHAFGSALSPLRVTVTIGVAPMGATGLGDAVSAADRALYRGKKEGRNRVELEEGRA